MDKCAEYANKHVDVIIEKLGQMVTAPISDAKGFIATELMKAYRQGLADAHRKESERGE